MKSVTNRAFMAKKKMYNQPEIEIAEVALSGTVCVSAGILDQDPNVSGGIGGGAPGRSAVPDSPHL